MLTYEKGMMPVSNCRVFLNNFCMMKVVFSYEGTVYRSTKSRNIYLWSKENPLLLGIGN